MATLKGEELDERSVGGVDRVVGGRVEGGGRMKEICGHT